MASWRPDTLREASASKSSSSYRADFIIHCPPRVTRLVLLEMCCLGTQDARSQVNLYISAHCDCGFVVLSDLDFLNVKICTRNIEDAAGKEAMESSSVSWQRRLKVDTCCKTMQCSQRWGKAEEIQKRIFHLTPEFLPYPERLKAVSGLPWHPQPSASYHLSYC